MQAKLSVHDFLFINYSTIICKPDCRKVYNFPGKVNIFTIKSTARAYVIIVIDTIGCITSLSTKANRDVSSSNINLIMNKIPLVMTVL